jgi:Anti-sigma-28 factor, FlgM
VRKEALAEQIARGEYVIDPHAVAEAMIEVARARALRGRPLRASDVFEAAQPLDRPPRVEQDEPGAGSDVA